ncbi:MAG: poly-gamma-glutamate synthase PgsB [candidate division WOR-3 bacterium]|nr:poly-gamma-glutamate synthase PgsB [candidate division WOR-3 bacterium]MDW8113743.1 poly-gamma-glutamate synthase PgsB [candidate division WOR-3 bacterium]
MIFLFSFLIIFLFYLFWEYQFHKKNVAKIKIRILVNGTRGKSSTCRLIAGGLLENNKKVSCKTTGTKPRLIINDKEYPIIRLGRANIIEEKKIFRRLSKEIPEFSVTECMALVPEYQTIYNEKLVKPHITVITNVRNDHLDVMGPTLKDVAINLARTIPKNGILFILEDENYLEIFKKMAKEKNCEIVYVKKDSVTDEMMKGFSYLEHKENVALALAVCCYLGCDKDKALFGMKKINPDPGVLRIFEIEIDNNKAYFVNTMAANDPDSIFYLWEKFNNLNYDYKIVLMNCRADRVERSQQLGELINEKFIADYYIATGFLTKPFISKLKKENILDLEKKEPEEVFLKISEIIKNKENKKWLIFATGNIVGYGEKLVKEFQKYGKEIDYNLWS